MKSSLLTIYFNTENFFFAKLCIQVYFYILIPKLDNFAEGIKNSRLCKLQGEKLKGTIVQTGKTLFLQLVDGRW